MSWSKCTDQSLLVIVIISWSLDQKRSYNPVTTGLKVQGCVLSFPLASAVEWNVIGPVCACVCVCEPFEVQIQDSVGALTLIISRMSSKVIGHRSKVKVTRLKLVVSEVSDGLAFLHSVMTRCHNVTSCTWCQIIIIIINLLLISQSYT